MALLFSCIFLSLLIAFFVFSNSHSEPEPLFLSWNSSLLLRKRPFYTSVSALTPGLVEYITNGIRSRFNQKIAHSPITSHNLFTSSEGRTCNELHSMVFENHSYRAADMWNISLIPVDDICLYKTPSWAKESFRCIKKGAMNYPPFHPCNRTDEWLECCCNNYCDVLSFRFQRCEQCPVSYLRLLTIRKFRTNASEFSEPHVNQSHLIQPYFIPSMFNQSNIKQSNSQFPFCKDPEYLLRPWSAPAYPNYTPTREPIAATISITSASSAYRSIVVNAFRKWNKLTQSWIPFWKFSATVKNIRGSRYVVIFRFKDRYASEIQ